MAEIPDSIIELHGKLYRVLDDQALANMDYFARQRIARAPHMAEFQRVVKAAGQRLAQLQTARRKHGLSYPTATYEGSAAHENEFFTSRGAW